jgi:dsDNA-specific endonuclease/ATPase MutS2
MKLNPMKKQLSILTLAALTLALPSSGFAAEKKPKATPAPTAAVVPVDGAKKPADAPAGPAEKNKVLPMNVRVDAIDAATNSFTHTNKAKGAEPAKTVKFVLKDKAEIKNGDAVAKFEDIKVGDTVAGSRVKVSDTEYEVVKITKFAVAPPKPKKTEGEAKPAEAAKPAEVKKP